MFTDREIPPLTELLKKAERSANEEPLEVGRVRTQADWPDISEDLETEDAGPSISERAAEEEENLIAICRTDRLRNRSWLCCDPVGDPTYCFHAYFPLEKDSREMTAKECLESPVEVYDAQLSELKEWIKNNAGYPELKTVSQAHWSRPPAK